MKKRLILIAALAFVVGLACMAYADVQNVKVGGDLTVYGLQRDLGLNKPTSGVEKATASIARVRVDTDLTDNVSATVRLLNERYWGSENETDANSTVDIDLAYAHMKEFLFSPLNLTIGRQELRFGNAMIIGDVDTNNTVTTASPFSSAVAGISDDADLSARKAFDAVRATFNYDPVVVDIISAKTREGDRKVNDDSDLYGFNLNYALSKTTNLEGYWFGKYTGKKATLANKTDSVNAVGGRIANQATANLLYQLEAAYQFGIKTSTTGNSKVRRSGIAVETALTYDKKDAKLAPSLTGLYAYFSGQKGDDQKTYKAWDPMYEDQKFGDIANAQFSQSNAHIAGVIGSIKPVEDVILSGEYYAFWWDKKYGNNQVITTARGDSVTMVREKFAGHEIDLKAIYNYTEDVQLSLLTGVFMPGKAFSSQKDTTATEVIGSMKVTF